MNLKLILTGLLFAALWASASAAAKLGLRSAEPLVLFQVRFLAAGIIMLAYSFVVQKDRLPKGKEWRELTIFGSLNVTLYLSFFVLGIKEVAAGLGSLATATNPLFISILSAFWIGRQVKWAEWTAVLMGLAGVAVATYPLFQESYASPLGLFYLFLSMLSYSVGTIYYSNIDWKLSRTAINGWQVFIGGVIMLPLTVLMHKEPNHYDLNFTLSVLWLTLPVSVLAVQLWLYLLKADAVKASMFLFLCPIFGFIYSYFLLNEPITYHTFLGTALVIAGLYIGQREKTK
ncbi:DMT family transporter [Emticicia sp. TH156]|uniref:DMT family transporter n=1 Tax=Emticicia sp. TH156 TaxID=2067454 RepID=UPI000C77D01F|nr:EamA family transporter [Emticicia sp. TH156]PLK45626.1 EamA family transporter [Emticicia sp. TH156]